MTRYTVYYQVGGRENSEWRPTLVVGSRDEVAEVETRLRLMGYRATVMPVDMGPPKGDLT